MNGRTKISCSQTSFLAWYLSMIFIIFISISRYGNQVASDELNFQYMDSRAKGFGSEVHFI